MLSTLCRWRCVCAAPVPSDLGRLKARVCGSILFFQTAMSLLTGVIDTCSSIWTLCCLILRHAVDQCSIRWRYFSGSLSPPLLSPEPTLTGLPEAPAGLWPSPSAPVAPAPLPVVPTGECRCGSGLLCASASESISSPASFPWLLPELSPILNNNDSFV